MYKSLEQRMAKSYFDLFPAFIPEQGAEVGVLEQEEFYLLMKKLYELAYDEPSLFVSVLHEDDAYPSRFKKSYGKPGAGGKPKEILKSGGYTASNDVPLGTGGARKAK